LIIFALALPSLRRLVFIGLLLFSLPVFPQRIMLLEKLGKGQWYRYEMGDEITLQRFRDEERFTGTITSVTDTGFTLDMTTVISLKEVEYVWRKYPARKKKGNYVMIAGGVLVGITTINNIANNNTVIDPVYVAVGAGISAAGLLWRSFSQPRYKVGLRWKLKVFDQEFL
jgi:NDP-sugar pyrophosphorylase family protein